MNAFARADGAWLLSDTAQFTSDGTLISKAPKVACSPHVPLALGWNGTLPPNIAEIVGEWLDRHLSAQAACANLPDLATDIVANLCDCDQGGHPEGFRLTMAYWDGERGRLALIGSNQTMGASIGREPLQMRYASTIFTPRLEPSPWPRDFDPRVDGKRLAELQRKFRAEDGTLRVGGRFTALRIHADGFEQFNLMDWPDPIGRRIGQGRFRFRWPSSFLTGGQCRVAGSA